MRNDDDRRPGRTVDLQNLPVFAPPTRLWTRIVAAQQARQTRRRLQWRRVGMAAAVVAIVGMTALIAPRSTPPPLAINGQQESQALEAEWQHLGGSHRLTPDGLTRLRFLDATLQAAYDRGAQTDELAALWQQRNTALRSLITQFREAKAGGDIALTRI